MPPFDLMTFLSQVLWFYLLFFIFLVLMEQILLPPVRDLFLTRHLMYEEAEKWKILPKKLAAQARLLEIYIELKGF